MIHTVEVGEMTLSLRAPPIDIKLTTNPTTSISLVACIEQISNINLIIGPEEVTKVQETMNQIITKAIRYLEIMSLVSKMIIFTEIVTGINIHAIQKIVRDFQ